MKTKDLKYKVRAVAVADLDKLYNMLLDLVKHEGLYERFKLTRERLESELFANNADWNCLVAADNQDILLGFCLYTFANINRAFNLSPMIQVDDLYISPLYRGAEIGQNLLYHLALIAESKNIGRLNIWCVKDNESGQNFYSKIGAEKRDFIDVFSIQVDKLLELRPNDSTFLSDHGN
ncbi:MAG: GNAT family N-acetyltransferase [Tatlockia sp.]|nr:GNAT family N-acetyltransferase [Tatlockia sp.]